MQMDVYSPISFPVNDVRFCMDTTFESTYGLVSGFSVDKLAYEATKFLNLQDDTEEVSNSIPQSHENSVFHLKNEFNPHNSTPTSQHKHMKPVSAMKGSREKRGVGPPKKLTVKWAPDVYDPVPSSALDMVINKPPRKHGKKKDKSGKEKSSGSKSSSRGSKTKGKEKDKKQSRKRSGKSSDMGF